ncbi:MAG: YggT family protein [Spirochaetales bacterium]|nr:YggT family protein [Spirochaetales bacterium]
MSVVLFFLSGVLTIYSFVIIFRIILAWFSGTEQHSGALSVLQRITDPYLNIFRRIKFLSRGAFDFSIILAILVLNILSFVLRYLATTVFFNIVTVIGAIALAVWQTVFFLLVFFAIVIIILIIITNVTRRTYSQIYFTLSAITEPFTSFIRRCIPGGKNLSATPVLVVTLVFISALCLFGIFVIEPCLQQLLLWTYI